MLSWGRYVQYKVEHSGMSNKKWERKVECQWNNVRVSARGGGGSEPPHSAPQGGYPPLVGKKN